MASKNSAIIQLTELFRYRLQQSTAEAPPTLPEMSDGSRTAAALLRATETWSNELASTSSRRLELLDELGILIDRITETDEAGAQSLRGGI